MCIDAFLKCTHPSFIFPTFDFLSAWQMGRFRVLKSCCEFSLLGGSIINIEEEGDINKKHTCEQYQL